MALYQWQFIGLVFFQHHSFICFQAGLTAIAARPGESGIASQRRTIYYGPEQEDTSVEFWRFFSDLTIEWKNDRFIVTAAIDVGTEKQADGLGSGGGFYKSDDIELIPDQHQVILSLMWTFGR